MQTDHPRDFARDFGRLEADVETLKVLAQEQAKKIDELLALANKGRGGLWVGMAVISAISSAVGFIADHFLRH